MSSAAGIAAASRRSPTSRAVLAGLAEGAVTIGEPAVPLATSLPRSPGILACSSRRASLRRREDVQWPRCALLPEGPRSATHWVDEYERFWNGSLDRLADHLANLNEEDDTDDDGTTDNQ